MNPTDLPDIFDKHMQMLTQGSFSPAEQQQKIFSSGEFAKAKARQTGWLPKEVPEAFVVADAGMPIGMGGNPNGKINALGTQTQKQMAASEADMAAAPGKASTGAPVPLRSTTPYVSPFDAQETLRLQRVAEQDAMDTKAKLRGVPANETEDQRSRRLHPELY